MSDELGPMSYCKEEDHIFLGREIAQHRDYSEETARKIDAEVDKLIDNAYKRAEIILKENLDILHALSDRLLEKETVLGKELDELILAMRPGFEFSSKTLTNEETGQESQTDVNAEEKETEEEPESDPETS
jgi:cell division protease FtsH